MSRRETRQQLLPGSRAGGGGRQYGWESLALHEHPMRRLSLLAMYSTASGARSLTEPACGSPGGL
jgi:hypothetical protein